MGTELTPIEKYNDFKIKRLLGNLKKRGMNGYYCKSIDELVEVTMKLVKDCKTASHGGSMTLVDSGIKDMLRSMPGLEILDREACKTKEEKEELYRKTFFCDAYFMSTNAISEDGVLVNIDGVGNRVAALIFGPKKVVIIAGVNKITATQEEAMKRARTVASPINCMRLGLKTPCQSTGQCADCLSKESPCNQIVITRRSMDPDRIHVILVDEEYGY